MFPSFLITFREVLEASLIVATVLGILMRLSDHKGIRTVWIATGAAALASIAFVGVSSLVGFHVHEWYSGATEELVEGAVMIVTALFITWAVFFLHNFFVHQKGALMASVQKTIVLREQGPLFFLIFIAVFREGFEIVLFLSTLFLSSTSRDIIVGFGSGTVVGLLFAVGIFTSARRLPIRAAVQVTNVLLILFAAGLFGRGVHALIETGVFGWFEQLPALSLPFIPHTSTFVGGFVKSLFGITARMESAQIGVYALYVMTMYWLVLRRRVVAIV